MIHTVLLASLGVYGVLAFSVGRSFAAAAPRTPPAPYLSTLLALIGAAQFAIASWVGRSVLRARGPIDSRLRRYFLLRGASAEAIGIYGLLASTLGAPRIQVVALLAMSAATLLASAPTRSAWDRAVEMTKSQDP